MLISGQSKLMVCFEKIGKMGPIRDHSNELVVEKIVGLSHENRFKTLEI